RRHTRSKRDWSSDVCSSDLSSSFILLLFVIELFSQNNKCSFVLSLQYLLQYIHWQIMFEIDASFLIANQVPVPYHASSRTENPSVHGDCTSLPFLLHHLMVDKLLDSPHSN